LRNLVPCRTTVSIRLPRRMRPRILIADDSPAVRAALRALLENAGPWEVIDAENGREALAKVQELKPDLIILDLVMPEMDGLAAARQISQLLPETPILLHTMHWSPQVNVEAQKVGVRHVVSKADSNLLLATVERFLNPVPSPDASSPSAASDSDPTVPGSNKCAAARHKPDASTRHGESNQSE
jgi:CheY-like chemotaxis protein